MISSVSTPSAASQTQQLSRPQGPPPPPSGGSESGNTPGISSSNFSDALAETAEAVGLSEEQLSSLQLDIQEAVDSLNGETDPRAIGDVVSNVVEQYGIDPEDFHDALGEPPSGGPPPQTQGANVGYGYDSALALSQGSASHSGYGIFSNMFALDVQA